MKPQLVEINAGASGIVATRDDVPHIVSAQAFDWPGLRLESGINNIASVDDVVGSHHYVSLNIDARPLTLEVKGPQGFRRVVLRQGNAWVCPAGDRISVRLDSDFHYIRMSIDPDYFNRVLGIEPGNPPMELRRSFGIAKSQIGHILGALVAESEAGNPGGLAFVEALATGLSHQVALHAGTQAPRAERSRGGLSAAAKRRALEVMREKLGANLTVETLAAHVDLSPAHFARAFKETTGRSPHQYLLTMRLDWARRLMEGPNPVLSDIAQRTGFSDQSHFTRLFKREFGITPGAVLKGRRSAE